MTQRTTFPSCDHAGYTWRTGLPDDDMGALTVLAAAVGEADGPASATWLHASTLVATDHVASNRSCYVLGPDGTLVAIDQVTITDEAPLDYRAVLDGVVHPAHRRHGLGTALLAWSQAQAADLLLRPCQMIGAKYSASIGTAFRMTLPHSIRSSGST